MALEGVAEGLTRQKIATWFWDPEWVAEEWYVGSWMHQRVKRRLSRARTMLKQYRDMATGR